jgi:hemolysin activation/secretion protein
LAQACAAVAACVAGPGFSAAAVVSNAPLPRAGAEAERRQEDKRKRVEQRANERPSALSGTAATAASVDLAALPLDAPCFKIRELRVSAAPLAGVRPEGPSPFASWLDRFLAPVIGQCVGTTAIQFIQEAANNALIARGYVTSRALIPEQNLTTGVLRLDLMAGRVSALRRDPGSGPAIGWSRTVLPFYPGSLYSQRDVDQAVESVRRLAGQEGASFDILPGEQAGESVLLLKPTAGKRWHATLGIDNFGLEATGRYELNGTLTVDSPLHLYDQLTVSGSTDADFLRGRKRPRAADAASINWNVPFGYASWFVNASRSHYLQTVAGFEEPLSYSGDSSELNAGVSYVAYRNASARTSAQAKLYHRYSHAYFDDEPLDYQSRDLIGYEVSLAHQQYVGRAVFSCGVGWRQTLVGATKNPGTALSEPAWDGRTRIATAHAEVFAPLSAGGQIIYAGQFNLQHAYTTIIPTDYFTIGTPYSVRGFDGQNTLAAEHGWSWRNELGWRVGSHTPFLALDIGRVSGRSAGSLAGTTLAGAALGMRGQLPATRYALLDYEVTLGWPLVKPRGLPAGHPSLLFQMTTRF